MWRMNDPVNIAEFLASDEFWQNPASLALTQRGLCKPDAGDLPDHHVLFATSGSSGEPKWIALSRDALLASASLVNRHLGVNAGCVWGLALPMHHVGGFGVVARARAAGCGMRHFAMPWAPHAFTTWMAEEKITHTSLVPTQIHDLVAAGCRAPGGLLAIVAGGGRLDTNVGRAARELGWPVLASYGMTEAASQIATQALEALAHPYAPHPLPLLPHWKARTNPQGCLEIAGPALFSGTVVKGTYRPRAGDWHVTGDRASITPEGLIPHGRADALVKIAGELIDPMDVECRIANACQADHQRIAVVAVPDERLGNRLIVVAERDAGADDLTSAIDAYNASVPRSQRIEKTVRIDEMPRGSLGKIRRNTLSAMV